MAGRLGPVDARTDLYAVGCLAFWMPTGLHVFDGSNAMQVMAEHARGTPQPPSKRGGRPVPEDLEKLVMTCLAKDPDERPRSADALAGALADCAGREPWTPDRARAWWEDTRSGSLADDLARVSTDGSWTGGSMSR